MKKSKLRFIAPLPKFVQDKLKEYAAYREEEAAKAAKAASKKKTTKKSK